MFLLTEKEKEFQMLDALNIIRGAVSTKELVPVLTHVHVYGGRIQGANGHVYIDAPCEELAEINCTIPCDKFITAVEACDGEPVLSMADNGRLVIKHKRFRVQLPLMAHDSFPAGKIPTSKKKSVKNGDLLRRLEQVREFVGIDASRPWACGALVQEGTIYATTNVVLASAPINFPGTFNLPSYAIDELLRIKREPVGVWQEENCVVFDLGDGVWLRSQLYDTKWPDTVRKMIQTVKKAPRVPDGLVSAIQRVIPFCPDTGYPIVQLKKDGVSTANGEMCAEVEGFKMGCDAWFHSEPLLAVLNKATHFDPSTYPDPCPFLGANDLKGLIIGVSV